VLRIKEEGVFNAEKPSTISRGIPATDHLARAGRSVKELAHEFEPSANAIRYWLKQAGLDEGLRSDGLTSDERAATSRLTNSDRDTSGPI
jgi:transposase-like protein